MPALEIELDLQLARRALVDRRRQRIRNRHHPLGIDPRPYDVTVRAPVLLVLNDKARLAGEAEVLFQRVDRLAPLRRRQLFVSPRVDIGLIEEVLAACAARQRLHLAECLGHRLGAEPAYLDELYPIVLLGVAEVLGPPTAGAAAAAVDDDRHRAYPPFSDAEGPHDGGNAGAVLDDCRVQFRQVDELVAVQPIGDLVQIASALAELGQHLRQQYPVERWAALRPRARCADRLLPHISTERQPGLAGCVQRRLVLTRCRAVADDHGARVIDPPARQAPSPLRRRTAFTAGTGSAGGGR